MDHLFPTKQESPGPLKEFFSEKLNLGNSLNLDFVFDSIKSSDNVVFSLSATSLQQLAELLGDAERAYRGFNFHALRHTFATRCIEAGGDCKTVSELLGHSSVNMTLNLYVHPQVEQKRRCVEMMAEIM